MTKKITKDWSIGKLLEKYPEAVDVFVKYGFHCFGCAFAQYETIEQGAKVHGLDDKEVRKLLDKLNKIPQKSKKKTKS